MCVRYVLGKYVCLLLTRLSYGTDKYYRETRTSINQTLFMNRSILFCFLIGTILTTCCLVTIAFICHLKYKQKYFHHHSFHQKPKHYMYIDRNNNDGTTYSYSIISTSPSKYHHLKNNYHRTYLKPIPSWYHRNTRQFSSIPRSPCCFLQYHDRALSSNTTMNRITSSSSDYSNGIEKEQMTSTSIMSNTSLDE